MVFGERRESQASSGSWVALWPSIRADGSAFEPAMNSYNHYAYGAVCQWLFEAVAGIRPDEADPGFHHIVFEPAVIAELSPVAAHHDSAVGRIEAGWKTEGDRVTYHVLVPTGARGTLVLDPSYREGLSDKCDTSRFTSEGNLSGGKKGAPLGESSITVGLEVLSAVEMALRVEMVEDRGVDRDELL